LLTPFQIGYEVSSEVRNSVEEKNENVKFGVMNLLESLMTTSFLLSSFSARPH
jgi:hypothetical protein